MKQRPGFITPTGIVVAIVLAAGVLVWALVSGHAMFSPGALNAQTRASLAGAATAGGGSSLGGVAAHADLRQCSACHPAPWSSKTMADLCLGCHTNVAGEIKAKNGMHGSLAAGTSGITCRGCHPEHNGPTGALTSLNEATFPHQLIGFSLNTHKKTAQGAAFTCADCHPKGYGNFDQAICADCHASMNASFMSQHEAAFGKDCLPCHDGSGRTTVDHSKFAFKLTGKHAGLPCSDCHSGDKSLQDYQRTPQDCYSCHAKDDHHKGSFGKDCGSCHTTNGWGDATFDHSVFPIDHGSDQQRATCQTCHPSGTSTYTCLGCHRHTPANVVSEHEGRSLAQLTDCIRCHPQGRGGGD